jgi:hypothetical protein
MKRCSTCGSTYADDSLGFCLTDGTALTRVHAPIPQGPSSFPSGNAAEHPTEVLPGNAPAPATPVWPTIPHVWQGAQPAAQGNAPKSKASTWIIGAIGLLLVLGLGAGLLVYLFKSGNETTRPAVNNGNSNNANASNGNANRNVNLQPSPKPTGDSRTTEKPVKTDAPPTDTDEVLSQLTTLENEWNNANLKADRAAIVRILADEFRGVGGNGSVEDKKQYLASMSPNTDIKTLTLSDLNVSLTGNNAVLTGLNTAKFKNGARQVYRFTDTFIWRDGRWQAISSQATRVK